MKERAVSQLLVLLILVGMIALPVSAADYTFHEGDVIYVPGGVMAGTQCEAYVMNSATVAAGEKVTVTFPEGTEKADGTTNTAGTKGNISGDRFWVMEGGQLKRIVAVWEGSKAATAYKFGYHDVITEVTDTTMTLKDAAGHGSTGVCTYGFNAACGDPGTNRYRECAVNLSIAEQTVILDLRADVEMGRAQAVATIAQIKTLCDNGVAMINTYVPDGAKTGGTAAVILVLDYKPKQKVAQIDVSEGSTYEVSKEGCNVDLFNGGGTLHMDTWAMLNIIGSVSGTTALTFDGLPREAVYITAPSATPDDAFRYNGVGKLTVTDNGDFKSWAISDLPDVGLTLTAPEGVTLKLYTEFAAGYFGDGGVMIPATTVTTENGITTNYYQKLASGTYHYKAKGEGFYNTSQTINYDAQKSIEGYTMQVRVERTSQDSFEPSYVTYYADGFEQNGAPSSTTQWGKEYEHLFTTPFFTRDKSVYHKHQQTTHDEMMAFLQKLDGVNDDMYVYSLGKSPKYGYDTPIVIFTRENLTGKTLEEAAAIIRADGKPTIQYQAQVHSTEPGSGEGALAVLQDMDGAYGEKVLDTIDMYIIPRLNADGAAEFIRYSATTGDDMNKVYISQNHDEVRMATDAYNLFLPEVAIDTHEMFVDKTGIITCEDIAMEASYGARQHPQAMGDMALDMMKYTLGNAQTFGIRTSAYDNNALPSLPDTGNCYFGMRNSLTFLIEGRGIHAGMSVMERRVFSQYIVVTGLIDYTVNNAKAVMDTVHGSRDHMVKTGATYEEDDLFVLAHTSTEVATWNNPLMDMLTGETVDPDHVVTWKGATDISRSRPRPTAYLIPKNEEHAEEILQLMDRHAVTYYELPAAAAVKVQQYIMGKSEATLTPEQTVVFSEGAYVFTLDQTSSTVLSIIMEPDYVKTSGRYRTLAEQKLVTKDANGYLPIYRYIHDLVDGKITVEETCTGDKTCPAAIYADVDTDAWYHTAVDTMLVNGIMSGDNATTFGTNDSLPRAMVVQILYERMGKPAVTAENKFTDVAEGAWYYDAVRWAADKGIVSGYGDGRFGPEDAITIEQAAVILHNYTGKPKAESDLSTIGTYSDWAAAALRWCEVKGLMKNIPLENAVDTATRAQTAQLLFNYLNP